MLRMSNSGRWSHWRGAGWFGATLLCVFISTLALVGPLGVTSAFAATSAQVTVNAGQSLGTLTSMSRGVNTAVWDGNLLDSAAASALQNAGITMLRYPGGSTSDVYHWQSNSNVAGQGTDNSADNFDAYMNMVQSIGAQTIITVDYGGGTPAEAAGWGQPLPAGTARGVALHESFGSVVAQVIEVTRQDGQPRVKRVVCAIDCGTVVNPGIVVRQMESCIVFGLTAALWGRIDIVDGEVRQKSFPDHPLMTMAQCPVIETHLVASDGPPTGVGEPGLPPVAPALANAWFALTGERRRKLPLLT